MKSKIGIIGGSGFYQIEGIKNVKKVKVTTPFGEPSDSYVTGNLEGQEVVFLTRHGQGHRILPNELNYCANIYGLKKLGVQRIISVSACGSLKEEFRPLDIVIPDQFFDRTNQARRMTFFGDGIVAHVGLAEPFCSDLSRVLYDSGHEVGANVHLGGTYLNMEGPQFSTKAESKVYRMWGMDVIGMTNMAEAKLAREAEMCYATLACITDYDCWRMDEASETVTVEMIVANLMKNVEVSKNILKAVLRRAGRERHCSCSDSLKDAIMTRPDVIPAATRKKMKLIIGKYIK